MTARCALYMGALKIFRSPWVHPRRLFPKFLIGFCSDGSSECATNFEVRRFTRSWDNSDCSFGWGLWTPNLGEEEALGGRGWYRSKERWWVSMRRSYIVTFPLSVRVSEILRLLCYSTPLFPHLTSTLPPKFSHVPLRLGGWPLG